MASRRVLQIGMDPQVIDFSPWPGQDAGQLDARIGEAEVALRQAGFAVTVCRLPDDPDAAEAAVADILDSERFDVVEIGSGLRTSHAYTPIFERVVNAVISRQPGVPLCFNDSPETTLEAVRRALPS